MKSALNAVNRRQRDLNGYRRLGLYQNDGNPYIADDGMNNDVQYVIPDEKAESENVDLEKALFEYLEEKSADNSKNRISSPFRERVEKDKARQKELLLSKMYMNRPESEASDALGDMYDKSVKAYSSNDINDKRSYAGWDSVGMKKRTRYSSQNPLDFYVLNGRENLYDEDYATLQNEKIDNYNPYNHFPVSKRSKFAHEHKRSVKQTGKTDPKVEKELSGIFNTKPKATKKPTLMEEKPKKDVTKEEVPKNVPPEKPLGITKKSINWSDYFGLDRRKKSGDDIDNEWLLERYHKTAAIASKRTEYPLQNFHDHDNQMSKKPNQSKLKEMDEKLKTLEESIVDDALKFTGSHEGTVDSKEIQEVKDRIITRLAAAYSLEKMRRAIGQYKESMEKSVQDDNINEDKRVSVARKQAVDKDRSLDVKEDNNIKCAEGTDGEDCEGQNYKPPSELLEESNWERGSGCPRIETVCNDVVAVLGHYGKTFEIACNMYQMCLFCGENGWFVGTRQCNVLFLAKADELCDEDVECRWVARQSVKYLLHVNRSLRTEPLTDCDIECPDRQ